MVVNNDSKNGVASENKMLEMKLQESERRYQALVDQMLKTQKLSALGELAAGIAHEIRNPLTSLRGFTQLLQASVDDDQKGYCEIMLSELDRINSIVGEL